MKYRINHLLHSSWNMAMLFLNEKVRFKISTTRYRKNSILCGALHIGTAKWTSGVGWSFGASRVARSIKGSGTGLTFDSLRIFSDLITKQKNSELKKYTTRTFETHIHTSAGLVTIL